MFRVRTAITEDIESIVKLVESAYRGDVSRQGWTTEADLIDGQRTDRYEVKNIIEDDKSLILLAEEDKQLLGSVHLLNKGDVAYLGMFAVSPERQGAGVGKSLISYAEKMAHKEWKCCSVEMTVITQRIELIHWYTKQGYELTGESRPFPYGDERYGIPKRDDLILDVLTKVF